VHAYSVAEPHICARVEFVDMSAARCDERNRNSMHLLSIKPRPCVFSKRTIDIDPYSTCSIDNLHHDVAKVWVIDEWQQRPERPLLL